MTLAAIDKARLGALLLTADTQVLEPNRHQVVAHVAKLALPAMDPWYFYPEIGGLVSYSAHLPTLHHRSATYVDKTLRGAKPADIPVEQPTKFEFELIIKLKTAKGARPHDPAVAAGEGGSGHRVMPLAQGRICLLCGHAYAIVLPPDEPETERERLRVLREAPGANERARRTLIAVAAFHASARHRARRTT